MIMFRQIIRGTSYAEPLSLATLIKQVTFIRAAVKSLVLHHVNPLDKLKFMRFHVWDPVKFLFDQHQMTFT